MIKEIINSIYPISNKAFRKLEPIVEYTTFEKNKIFIHKNKPNKNEYIVIEGICKNFLINPDGEDITISFFQDKSVISPYTCRTLNGISMLYFQTLSEMKVAVINAKLFEKLMIEDIEIREYGNTVLRNELMRKVKKEIGLASLTAKERLIEFRNEFPLLEVTIPHTDIASYLGITNISLSRLRKDLLN